MRITKSRQFQSVFTLSSIVLLLCSMLILLAIPMTNVNGQKALTQPEINALPSKIALNTQAWIANGTAICTANQEQDSPVICSDGAGGAIIAWEDVRSGASYDIYAQRIDSNGGLKWTANGIAICTKSQEQEKPEICSDGAGGAIITWQDHRSGTSWDIYAQWVSATGMAHWTANGTVICTANNDQINPEICSDGYGSGGAIITWQDHRSGTNWDIYAQRIISNGGWLYLYNGSPICKASNEQGNPQICSDGSEGAIITWQDHRSGTNWDIYAQRIDAFGVKPWTDNGTPICTANNAQTYPQICSDGSGGAIITWMDNRSGNMDINAQRIDSNGGLKWTANGTAICRARNYQYFQQMCSDGAGGAIITWYDMRSGTSSDIYAQRINSTEGVQWTANGTAICTADNPQMDPQICSDGSGGAVISWEDNRNGNWDIYAQRVNARGIGQWTANGTAICTADNNQYTPPLCNTGAGSVIITWYDYRSGTNGDIYAKQVPITSPSQPIPFSPFASIWIIGVIVGIFYLARYRRNPKKEPLRVES